MKKEKGIKKTKFEERILNELNLILRQNLSDKRLQFASLTKVDLTSDYSIATVYWDTFDSSKRGDIKKALEAAEGKMRTSLSRVLNVRHTPIIKMTYDSQFESEMKIDTILSEEVKNGKNF